MSRIGGSPSPSSPPTRKTAGGYPRRKEATVSATNVFDVDIISPWSPSCRGPRACDASEAAAAIAASSGCRCASLGRTGDMHASHSALAGIR